MYFNRNLIRIRHLQAGQCFRYNGDTEHMRVLQRLKDGHLVYSLDSGKMFSITSYDAWGILVEDSPKVATGQCSLFRTEKLRKAQLNKLVPRGNYGRNSFPSICCPGHTVEINVKRTHYFCLGCAELIPVHLIEKLHR